MAVIKRSFASLWLRCQTKNVCLPVRTEEPAVILRCSLPTDLGDQFRTDTVSILRIHGHGRSRWARARRVRWPPGKISAIRHGGNPSDSKLWETALPLVEYLHWSFNDVYRHCPWGLRDDHHLTYVVCIFPRRMSAATGPLISCVDVLKCRDVSSSGEQHDTPGLYFDGRRMLTSALRNT